MADVDNTNLQPPDLGPGLPSYPWLAQLVRVSGAALPGTLPRVYPAFTQQFNPPLSLRDREPCYLLEANNVTLSQAVYDCRLVGGYLSAPLYATACCAAAGSSSSAAPAPAVVRAGLGSAAAFGEAPLGETFNADVVLENLSVPPGARLGACLGVAQVGGSDASILSFRFADREMLPAGDNFAFGTGGITGRCFLYSDIALPPSEGDLVVTVNFSGTVLLLLSASWATGLPRGQVDQTTGAALVGGAPDTGAVTTGFAPELAQAAFLLLSPASFTWGGGFTTAGQDASGALSGQALTLTEGYQILNSAGTADATLSGTPVAFSAALATYA